MSEPSKPVDEVTGVTTTGHEWDGIRELNMPLPRWWLWLFYASIVFALVYALLYPSIPLIDRAWPGLLNYSSRQNLENDIVMVEESRAALDQEIAALSFDDIRSNDVLFQYAQRGGASSFKIVCVQCHGSGATGSQEFGYPNLNDDAWLWGGTLEAIHQTITHGIRSEEDADSRQSQMLAFGSLGLLDRDQIDATANYVLKLSGQEHDEARAAEGAAIFATQCVACHGADGTGNQELGAPNLSDSIWLYGGSRAAIMTQIAAPRHGVMPAWGTYFDDATLKKLAIYVHSLGGGQ